MIHNKPSTLAPIQQKRLISSFFLWLDRIERAHSQSVSGPGNIRDAVRVRNFDLDQNNRRNQVERAFDDMFFDATIAVFGIHQLSDILELLAPHLDSKLTSLRDKFEAAYASADLGLLRNLLEHSSEYEVGIGLDPRITSQEQNIEVHSQSDVQRISSIEAFGMSFDISDAYDLVFELEEPMLRFRQTLA
ncbi:MAG: hypothetical protein IH960_10460 [Chloroflexi bacterium]|nr:hypothetical protein [Chloroflexota bacterium]